MAVIRKIPLRTAITDRVVGDGSLVRDEQPQRIAARMNEV
jgi:hypothetical protein